MLLSVEHIDLDSVVLCLSIVTSSSPSAAPSLFHFHFRCYAVLQTDRKCAILCIVFTCGQST